MAVSKISIRRDFKQAGTGYNNSKKAKKEKLNLYWLNSNLDQDKPGRTTRGIKILIKKCVKILDSGHILGNVIIKCLICKIIHMQYILE